MMKQKKKETILTLFMAVQLFIYLLWREHLGFLEARVKNATARLRCLHRTAAPRLPSAALRVAAHQVLVRL
ncbi:hypothetical protein E2C01_073281 [Portunus trituberculatus]|uniref:Uncharacterized protein n=1 Tax=Portunus trituberculatus TaxID=210409 RepID=A0A5B7I910_PORTR|nr:hypothetical protein [Portunus trituberculatus]